MTIEFQTWPKTTRLFRDMTVTEKMNGSNGCIIFEPCVTGSPYVPGVACGISEYDYAVQSRNRLITPGKTTDNAGFAQWVYDNHEELFEKLGYGRHYGEWWGRKVTNQSYGLDHRVFSLFNVDMWQVQPGEHHKFKIGQDYLSHVPVLYRGMFSEEAIKSVAGNLLDLGSVGAAQFGVTDQTPEGVCIFHSQSRIVQKFTFDNNDAGKWESL